MENDKNLGFGPPDRNEEGSESAPRARNRTVMLTPEITGQVRARLAQELGDAPAETPGMRPRTGGVRQALQGSVPPQLPQERTEQRAGSGERPAYRESAAAAPQPQAEGIVWLKSTPIVGFLVSFDKDEHGEFFVLRSGRLIVSSQPAPGNNCLLLDSETVSPMHAIMRVGNAGEVQVLDQLSEHGTRIRRFGASTEEELSGEKSTLEHGDVIMFGERKFHVCVLAGVVEL